MSLSNVLGTLLYEGRFGFGLPTMPITRKALQDKTWVRNGVLVVAGLPDIQDANEEVVQEYARNTWMPTKWIKEARTKPRPRALCGIPVEVNGQPWGVIVLDSRSPEGIAADPDSQRFYKLTGRVLALMLARRTS